MSQIEMGHIATQAYLNVNYCDFASSESLANMIQRDEQYSSMVGQGHEQMFNIQLNLQTSEDDESVPSIDEICEE